MDDIPNFDDFMKLNYIKIKDFMISFDINTIYFAISGYHSHPNEGYNSKLGISNKFSLINSLDLLYTAGFQNIIVLLNDDTKFSLPKPEFDKVILNEVQPLWNDIDFLNFYNKAQLQIYFSGFNEMYIEKGYEHLLPKMRALEKYTTLNNTGKKLIFHTASSPADDVVRLMINTNLDGTRSFSKEGLIKSIYGCHLSEIDVSIYSGSPKENRFPILLNNNGLRIYTNFDNLELNWDFTIRMIYYTILHKQFLKNKSGNPLIIDTNNISISDKIYAEESYLKKYVASNKTNLR